jgi:hypothetical protein
VKIRDFEKKIRDRDGITIVIRARRTADIRNYRESRANHTTDVSDYIKNNLNAYMDNTYELSIIDGFGNEPTGGTSVGAIRESYRHREGFETFGTPKRDNGFSRLPLRPLRHSPWREIPSRWRETEGSNSSRSASWSLSIRHPPSSEVRELPILVSPRRLAR